MEIESYVLSLILIGIRIFILFDATVFTLL